MFQRWNQHIYTSTKPTKKGWSYFPNAIRKYGKDAFSHEILEVCDSLEGANLAEEKWIDHFNTRDLSFGFNIKKGGNHIPHPVQNPWDRPEHRERNLPISRENVKKATLASSIQKTQSKPENRQKLSSIMKIQASTPEGRAQRIAASKPGKILSLEHRQKISMNDATKRPKVREKLSIKSREFWSNPERHKAASERQRGKIPSLETRMKIGQASMGRIWSEESRAKLSASIKAKPKMAVCKRGHSMDDPVISSDGRRRCRECCQMRAKVSSYRKKERRRDMKLSQALKVLPMSEQFDRLWKDRPLKGARKIKEALLEMET